MKCDLRNQDCRSVLSSRCMRYCAALACSLLFLLINTLNSSRIKSNGITVVTSTAVSERRTESELPLCTRNLLNQSQHKYDFDFNGFRDISRTISNRRSCQLLHYTTERTVACLDSLLNDRNSNSVSPNPTSERITIHNPDGSPKKGLHFVFMGDSRIRQQFLNFLKMIPDYDRKSKPSVIPSRFHYDIDVTSQILRLKVSFKWRPLMDSNVTETLRQWTTLKATERPCLIFLSIVVWHMLRGHGADFQLYQEKLTELAPMLGQLANASQVIWLNQYPTADFNGEKGNLKNDIHSEKIHHYNKAIRRILGVYRGIRIWDSSNPLAEEYIRSCAMLERDEPDSSRTYDSFYFNCNDFIHTGYSALSQATQLLFNDICNDYVDNAT